MTKLRGYADVALHALNTVCAPLTVYGFWNAWFPQTALLGMLTLAVLVLWLMSVEHLLGRLVARYRPKQVLTREAVMASVLRVISANWPCQNPVMMMDDTDGSVTEHACGDCIICHADELATQYELGIKHG